VEIAIPVFDRLTALDAVGPYEVLWRLPGADITWLAHEPGLVRTDNRMLALEATARFEELPHPDVIVVPGGLGTRDLVDDQRMIAWLREAHRSSTWTTSVCTGSLLLGAAGILKDLSATSHWTELETLRGFGATPVEARVVPQGKVVTAAGVSSGIDMALWLGAQIAGEDWAKAVQRAIEYDPRFAIST
jgi:putative intracellular protease/amidase